MRHHHHWQQFFGRHHGGRGTGRFGHGFGFDDEGDFGGRGFGRGRKLGSPDLQLLILGLLADKPRHGYEIIKALEERSKGFYAPSPGMVYPALTYLEEIGHATVEAEGARKLYQITAAGTAYLAEHQATVDSLFNQFGRVGERMEQMRRAFRGDGQGAGERGGSEDMMRARRDLKTALAQAAASSPEEERRIIEILQRATAEILKNTSR